MNDSTNLNDYHLANALKKARNPIFIVDKSGLMVWCNQAYADQIGKPIDLIIRQQAPALTPTRESVGFFMELWNVVMRGETWTGELQERRADGSVIHVHAVFTPLSDVNGRPTLFLVFEHDITNSKDEYEKLWQIANYDRLTGLHNRNFFTSVFERIITQAARNQKKAAVLFIDLDGFKGVNDSLGHEGGDEVLVEVAKVLQSFVRKSDVVARFGGDEFACILDEVESIEAAERVAKKMVDAIGNVKEISIGKVNVGASIGIAIYPEHGLSQKEIRIAADKAMYDAKNAGKRCSRTYHHQLAEGQK